MDEKINLKAVEQYSEAYSSGILNNFFSKKETITGPEILELCDIKQVNFFVLHELFKAWKEENKKIRSPYFNYQSDAVKEALENLMSALSNNISVDRAHFAPLFKKSVYQTLLLVLDPYDFYSDLISGVNDKNLEVEAFKEQIKYIKINKAPLEKLQEKLQEKNIQQITGNEAFAMLDQILEEVNFTPEDVEGYMDKFSSRLKLNLENLYESKNEQPPQTAEQKSREQRPETPKANVVKEVSSVSSTINNKLSNDPRPTLADNFKKISRIKDSLTINQKFMFTKVLFHGDFELFSKAVDDIDRFENMNAALRYLEENYEEWDKESEEFHEFMEMVEKRFS